MSRPPRSLLSQSYHHIMTRGNNRHKVFECGDDFLYYLELIKKYKAEHPFDLFHYCLMPNHIHMLVKTNKASDFSNFMKRLNLAYFHHYRQNYGWIGHFWQDRFKSQAVGKDIYFIQCGKYIELNPVRANIVEYPEEYIYSSYDYYSQGKSNSLISVDPLYLEMGQSDQLRQERYSKLIIGQVIEESYRKNIWGSDLQRYREQDKINRKQKSVI